MIDKMIIGPFENSRNAVMNLKENVVSNENHLSILFSTFPNLGLVDISTWERKERECLFMPKWLKATRKVFNLNLSYVHFFVWQKYHKGECNHHHTHHPSPITHYPSHFQERFGVYRILIHSFIHFFAIFF